MDAPGPILEPQFDPAPELIRSYQRRLRKLRNLMLVENLVFVPLVLVLAAMLVWQHVERGRAASISFGTQLEVIVQDVETAGRVLADVKQRAAGGRLPPQAVSIQPEPVIAVVPREGREVLTEAQARQAIEEQAGKKTIQIVTRAAIIKVNGAPVVAAASEQEAQLAIDAMVSKYSHAMGLVSQPKVVTHYDITEERRAPSSVKFSQDEIVSVLDAEVEKDKYEFIGPNTTVDTILSKYGLAGEQLQFMNRGTKLSGKLEDGAKLLVKPGRDRLEIEYDVNRTEVGEVAPPVKEEPDPTLEKGKTQVVSEGKPGQGEVTYRITCHNEREVKWAVLGRRYTVPPVDKVVKVGTKEPASADAHQAGNRR